MCYLARAPCHPTHRQVLVKTAYFKYLNRVTRTNRENVIPKKGVSTCVCTRVCPAGNPVRQAVARQEFTVCFSQHIM